MQKCILLSIITTKQLVSNASLEIPLNCTGEKYNKEYYYMHFVFYLHVSVFLHPCMFVAKKNLISKDISNITGKLIKIRKNPGLGERKQK